MTRSGIGSLVALAWVLLVGTPSVFAQPGGNRERYEAALRTARWYETLGYVLVGVGGVLIVASVPVGVYLDRRRKARRRAERERAGGVLSRPDPAPPGPAGSPGTPGSRASSAWTGPPPPSAPS